MQVKYPNSNNNNNMKIEDNIITANEGKVLRRISDQQIFGSKIYLGYTHYLNG